jgi:hypothetical protein
MQLRNGQIVNPIQQFDDLTMSSGNASMASGIEASTMAHASTKKVNEP